MTDPPHTCEAGQEIRPAAVAGQFYPGSAAKLRKAIEKKQRLEIVYLKSKDEKSRRVIKPLVIGEMEYSGHLFFGLEAVCMTRRAKRVFNVDKILEIAEVE